MAIWTFYDVILPAVVPVMVVWFGLFLAAKPASLLSIVGDGQLCFFTIALLAVMIHDIESMAETGKHTAWADAHLPWAFPSALAIIIVVVLIFWQITLEKNGTNPLVKRRLTAASIFMTLFGLAVIYYWRGNLELFA